MVKHFAPTEVDTQPTDAALNRIQLRKALRGLDEKKRLALVLHWYLDLPLDERLGL